MTATQIESVLLQLREMIMRGEFPVGSRLMEIPLARSLNVSRTPVRLALQTLAQEGLLVYAPQRGFMVRAFSIKEILDAVDVRGRLEALACGIVAAAGLPDEKITFLERNLAATYDLFKSAEFGPGEAESWKDLNGAFHDVIVSSSANQSLIRMVRQFDLIPFAAARNFAATPSNLPRLRATVEQNVRMHDLVFDAIRHQQPDRAEMLMREHVYQGREGLRRVLERLSTVQPTVPMLRLVAESS